ncbi:hypothetical protein J6590_024209 [Homalodisca vitripennis]|nr:hypothetical protein J6590_024209 [Homalodisca vitripennis]
MHAPSTKLFAPCDVVSTTMYYCRGTPDSKWVLPNGTVGMSVHPRLNNETNRAGTRTVLASDRTTFHKFELWPTSHGPCLD